MGDFPPPSHANLGSGAGHDNPSQPPTLPPSLIMSRLQTYIQETPAARQNHGTNLAVMHGVFHHHLRNLLPGNVPAQPPLILPEFVNMLMHRETTRRHQDPYGDADGDHPADWLDDFDFGGDGGEGYTAAPEIGHWLGGTYIAGDGGGGYTAAPARDDGLAEEVIARLLKTTSYEEAAVAEGVEVCAVCQDDLERKDRTVGVLRCRHRFHGDCIGRWLRKKNVCPLCKGIALDLEI